MPGVYHPSPLYLAHSAGKPSSRSRRSGSSALGSTPLNSALIVFARPVVTVCGARICTAWITPPSRAPRASAASSGRGTRNPIQRPATSTARISAGVSTCCDFDSASRNAPAAISSSQKVPGACGRASATSSAASNSHAEKIAADSA